MKVTLENIEIIRDKTGVTYEEANEILSEADGDVVKAIIMIENKVNEKPLPIKAKKDLILKTIEGYVRKGNITKIVITKNQNTVLNLPLNAGIVGAVIAPIAIVAGAITAVGLKCNISLITDDGKTIDVVDKVEKTFNDAKSKATEVYEKTVVKKVVIDDDDFEDIDLDEIIQPEEVSIDKVAESETKEPAPKAKKAKGSQKS